jgi:neutral ceramidase
VNAVCQADATRTAARCGFGFGIEDKVAFNRRLRMQNGLCFSHPGKGNPETIGYAGPIDPQVGVVGTWSREAKLIGCLVNYACHATTNPGGISANWIYYLEKVIRGAFGPDVVVVFMQGACGDITQVDNLSKHDNPAPEKWAQFVGGRVGAEAVKALLSLETGDHVPVAAKSKLLHIKRRIPKAERVRQCVELVQADPKKVGSTEWTFAKEIVLLDASLKKQPIAEVEVQVIQVGPAVFVSNPAELFVEFGLDLKKRSGFLFTFPVELANGCVGYVPTEEALGPRGGGYETRLTSYSNLEPSAGRQMIEAGLELIKQLHPGEIPQPRPAPPFKAPWSYGNVPAELD